MRFVVAACLSASSHRPTSTRTLARSSVREASLVTATSQTTRRAGRSAALCKKTSLRFETLFFCCCIIEELHLPLCHQVLKLLITAWDRRLIFTIGTSSTTGESDTVVWNEIHHKTEFGSNLTGHGYPDPNYLDNVLTELSAQGVGEDNLKD